MCIRCDSNKITFFEIFPCTAFTAACAWAGITEQTFWKGDLIPKGLNLAGGILSAWWSRLEHLFWAWNESSPRSLPGLSNEA
jgi:hypothetical protein